MTTSTESELTPGEAVLYYQALGQYLNEGKFIRGDKETAKRFRANMMDVMEGRGSVSFSNLRQEERRTLQEALRSYHPDVKQPDKLAEYLSDRVGYLSTHTPIPSEETTIYGLEWDSIRESVIDRDGGECQECGMTRDEHKKEYGTDLHVHHKIPVSKFKDKEQANRKENLVTLCAGCHRSLEGD